MNSHVVSTPNPYRIDSSSGRFQVQRWQAGRWVDQGPALFELESARALIAAYMQAGI